MVEGMRLRWQQSERFALPVPVVATSSTPFWPRSSLSPATAISADAAPAALLWLKIFQLANKCS